MKKFMALFLTLFMLLVVAFSVTACSDAPAGNNNPPAEPPVNGGLVAPDVLEQTSNPWGNE